MERTKIIKTFLLPFLVDGWPLECVDPGDLYFCGKSTQAPTPMSKSRIDPQLLQRLRAGDALAAAEFLELYKDAVCERLGINLRRFSDGNYRRPMSNDSFRSEVESQFNNAYTKVMEKIRKGELDDSLSPVAYMTVIASNQWIDRARARSRNPSVPIDDAPDLAVEEDLDQDLMAQEIIEAFHRSIDLFSEKEQAIFRLRYIEDKSVEEIAEHLGLEKKSVRARSSDVIKRLRRLCGEARTDC